MNDKFSYLVLPFHVNYKCNYVTNNCKITIKTIVCGLLWEWTLLMWPLPQKRFPTPELSQSIGQHNWDDE